MPHRVFLLSPANSSGRRAALLTRPSASFELARRVQIGDATLGEVFAFCSGLYFRGKLAYAQRFADPAHRVHIITPSRGLLSPEHPVNLALLEEFASVPVDPEEPRFAQPLIRTCTRLATSAAQVILLGSIATGKYLDCLLPIFHDRLLFPRDFVGRGDMSRGALLLRSATAGRELPYIPINGSIVRGRRAPSITTHPVYQTGNAR